MSKITLQTLVFNKILTSLCDQYDIQTSGFLFEYSQEICSVIDTFSKSIGPEF